MSVRIFSANIFKGVNTMNKLFKKIGTALCGVLAAAMLSGCMYIGVGVELRKDGTGSVFASYGMSSEYCTEEDFADSEYEIKRFNVGGKEYIGYDISEEYSSYEELSKELTSLSEDGTSLFTSAKAEKKGNFFVSKYTFDAVMPPLLGDDAGEYAGMASDMITVDFTLRMPGTVKYCEGGNINDDGSISFIVDPSAECTYSVESSELNFANIFIALGAVLVIIAVVIVVSRKKKS